MGLKLQFSARKHLSKIIWGIILIVLVACIARVAIWEHHYYTEMEGRERATSSIGSIETDEVDEADVTDQDLREWVVAADRPRYLSIPALGITKARIVEVGVKSNGQLGTPVSIFDAGWYRDSSRPGYGGTVLLDGHNGGPTKNGIFKNLPLLVSGDKITIERGDGTIFTYKVVDNVTVPLSEADDKMAWAERSPVSGTESLSIISCTGDWSQTQRTYLSRQFLRAVLVK